MRINKKDEIVNVLFTVFLLATQQICLLYAILSSAKSNNLYLLFLIVDVFLCVYIVLSLYDENNAGVKISIQWMMYMITLSSKMAIFSFLIKNEKKYSHQNGDQNGLFFTYLSNDVLVYNLIYLTPFIYLLFSLRSRNILENILNNKIVVENILSIDVNIINLFDLIDLIFMYSHLTNLYKIFDHMKMYRFQNVLIMLLLVLVDISLFGFYFPIYTNIDKSYSYTQESVGMLKGDRPPPEEGGGRLRDKGTKRDGKKTKHSRIVKQKKRIYQSDSYGKYETAERKKDNLFYATNGGSGSIANGRSGSIAMGRSGSIAIGRSGSTGIRRSGSTAIRRSAGGRSSSSGRSTAGSLLSRGNSTHDQSGSHSSVRSERITTVMNPANVRNGTNLSFLDQSNVRYMKTNTTSKLLYSENDTNVGVMDKRNHSPLVSYNSKDSTYASSDMSKELPSREFSSSSFSTLSFSSSSLNSSYLSSDGSNFGSSHSASFTSSTSSSSYLPSFLSFSSSENKAKSNKSYHQKYKDVYTDVYITAKFHFIVGFLLIDVPFFVYRLLFCLKHKIMLTLIVKNVLFLLFRSYKLNEYRLVEKEKYKNNKSNLDFDFYNLFSVDSKTSGYPEGDATVREKGRENRHGQQHAHRHPQRGSRMKLPSFQGTPYGQVPEDGAEAKSKRDQRSRKVKKGNTKRGTKREKTKRDREKADKSSKKRKKKKKNTVMQVFKEEFKENKKKLLLEKAALQEMGLNPNSERVSRGSIVPLGKVIDNDGEEYTEKGKGGEPQSGGKTEKSKKISAAKFTWKERRQMRSQFRKFKNLIYKLKYKRNIPIYHFKLWDHIRAMCTLFFKRFGSSNFVYLDDQLVFSYFTNLRLIFLVFLNYVMRIGITIFFIFLLLNNHIRVSDHDFVYMYQMPVKPLGSPGVGRGDSLTFPDSFDVTKYTHLQLPKEPIPIHYINKDMEDNSRQFSNRTYFPKGYVQLEMPDNLFNSTWEHIFKLDKIYMYGCLGFFFLYFVLLLGTSTFFDILFGAIVNTLSHLSFYFSLKQFVLFFFTFHGNLYNGDYIFHSGQIRKLNYKFEYLMLLLLNLQQFASLCKHASLFLRVLLNCRYVYYRRSLSRARNGRRNQLRHSVSVYLLFLLCKYAYAPVNLNTLLFGKNILNNILLIDNINGFTWVNIIVLTLFKGTQILLTKTNYFIIGLFILHILLYVIYAIHAQILRYIILRKMEILFSFKNILISKYEETPLVPDRTSPYVTCRDILKYYSEEGFFSSEGNMIPNFI
ncbi:hypothetical protein C922_01680 [Plasmodium inui San Antonio 1]|uniref:Uncharacterized protein n=1 Tax=Plasmodium inui San Antonio 1 TaxID=1237626 RepID=W7A9Y8_9APIC|nr:hypothetical protein C922_01680 [Plasmodium inui San Antonio 1]EUD68068.1 hypothetical protein C922_01680 [Plasmodium inui San Antonio 1]